jgi:D-alanyl-D-alanine carboxypeptidase/D-alanyl-D-alanine-endopeptidase (penicillin-binding protein 4)
LSTFRWHVVAVRSRPKGTTLGAQIVVLLADPAVSRAHWGIAVTTLDGQPIYGFDEGQLFRPASNNKIFTTATAMALLGPDATVTTTVTTTGTVDSAGTLHGDLVLHGAGDANLSGQTFPYQSPAKVRAEMSREHAKGMQPPPKDPLAALDDLAAQIADHQIKRVEGSVVGDDKLWPWEPYGNSWEIDDAVWGYGAPVSALVVNDNTIQLIIHAGPHVGDSASITTSPAVEWVSMNNGIATVPRDGITRIDVNTDGDSSNLRISGSIALGKTDTEDLAITSPASYAAKAFLSRLVAHGIEVTSGASGEEIVSVQTQDAKSAMPLTFGTGVGSARGVTGFEYQRGPLSSPVCDKCTVLASRTSPTLADDITLTLKISQNLHAEMMLRRLGAAFGSEGSFEQGALVVRKFLINAGVDSDDFVSFDGSGLSSHDLVTPRATATFLAFAAKQSWFPAWKASLPEGGEDGSLDRRFPDLPLKDHLFAKTGTLGESRGLSGYLDAASGRPIIFSIFVDTHTPATSVDRVVMDKIVTAIAATN